MVKGFSQDVRLALFSGLIIALTIFGIGLIVKQHYGQVAVLKNMIQVDIPVLQKTNELKVIASQMQQMLSIIAARHAHGGQKENFSETDTKSESFSDLINQLIKLDNVNRQRYEAILAAFNDYYANVKRSIHVLTKAEYVNEDKYLEALDATANKMIIEIEQFVLSVQLRSNNIFIEQINSAFDSQIYLFIVATILLGTMGLFFFTLRNVLVKSP